MAEWYLHGVTQQVMAERLSAARREFGYTVSRTTVTRDLAEIRRRWVAQQLTSFDERRSQEVAKIDELERVYWERFELSKRPRERTRTRQQTDADGGVTETAELAREEREGTHAWLQGVERCIARRIKLFGLEAREVVGEMVRREAQRIAQETGRSVDDVLAEAEKILRGEI